ncbi:hypothetical protein B0H14DRAFT_3163836 [Mycena olivaceomarginata]|nr:hypothetical protein B0H14DRAFT_3163836 [Mycena olivaceomarginata]
MLLESDPTDGDAEVSNSYLEADGHDCAESVRTECGSASRSAEDSNSENQESPAPGSSSVAEGKSGPPRPRAEMVVISGTFKFLMNVQLALILFLGLSWLYE